MDRERQHVERWPSGRVSARRYVAAIERAVEPAMVRTLPGGVYFQLTASVADAMGDEAMEKQRRFTELAEPLLPPPIAPR
jgi:hypothetical protein